MFIRRNWREDFLMVFRKGCPTTVWMEGKPGARLEMAFAWLRLCWNKMASFYIYNL